jgi:predicted TIM-barrel fold metal-dependent hydrolase
VETREQGPLVARSLFDADTHYYEALDAFTRYADPTLSHKTVRWITTDDGKRRLLVGEHLFRFIANPTFDPIGRPGALTAMFNRLHRGERANAAAVMDLEPIRDEYVRRGPRLERMDAQGVQAAIVLPTLALTVEHLMRDDPEMTYANLHSFNRWLDDEWGFDHEGRLYAPPLLSLLDVDLAIKELDWVIGRGARIIHIRPCPVNGRSIADSRLDPFWSRVNEAGISVAFHASEAGYNEMVSSQWGEEANPPTHRITPFQWTTSFGDRPIFDTVAALVLHGLFERFPNVRVASIEMGSLWVPYLLGWLDKAAGLGRRVVQFAEPPSETFRRHVYVAPYPEEDIPALVALIGADQVLFGSDWPHLEGLAEPRDYLQGLSKLTAADAQLITSDNALALVGGPT